MKKLIITSIIVLLIFTYFQVTLFVVQPIGVVPEGKTLVILRMNKMHFIDSADAMCEREMNGVSLLCRGVTMAAVVNKGIIIFRLPYSDVLYKISTNGKTYSR